jgi:hypothetical protein
MGAGRWRRDDLARVPAAELDDLVGKVRAIDMDTVRQKLKEAEASAEANNAGAA